MTKRAAGWPLLLAASLVVAGCRHAATPATEPALQRIDAADLARHLQTLASDDFEGRGVGTHGEDVTVGYLIREFQRLGLSPGNPDGCSAPGQGLDELHRIRWTERGARLEDLLAVDEEAHVLPETVLLIHDAEAETRPLPVEVGQQLSERGPAGLNLPLPGVREQRTRNHDLHAKTPVSTA